MFGGVFARPVVKSESFRQTGPQIGKIVRNAEPVFIGDQPMFFPDVPSPAAQEVITLKTEGKARQFTPEEIEAIRDRASVNKPLNDALLLEKQALYDDQDYRRMAGIALLSALGGAGLNQYLRGGEVDG